MTDGSPTEGKAGTREAGSQPRPAAVALRPIALPRKQAVVRIDSERELLLMVRELMPRVQQDPEFSVLLLANPVLALKAYGIELSPALRDHVLRALRHPKGLRERRAELEARLEEALGEVPRPTDPEWMARLVFETRALAPRDLRGLAPAYGPEMFDKAIGALQAQRPARTSRYPGVRRLPGSQTLSVAPVKPAIRRLDLGAPVPETPAAKARPTALSLEEAWFYKADPVVAEALELGQIARRAVPFRSPETFRKLQSGELVDVFRAFVRTVSIKDSKGPGSAPPPKDGKGRRAR